MKKIALAGTVVLVVAFAWWLYQTAEGWRRAGMAKKYSCDIPFEITWEAERKPGGALYGGPLPTTDMNMKEKLAMIQLEKADHRHAPRIGGELFMAGDMIHHLETLYSDQCGLQIYFFNAFIEPIKPDRFKAFVLLIPDGVNKPFVGARFLLPSRDGKYLHTTIFHEPEALLGGELYVKYPEKEAPEMYDIYLGE